MIGLLFFLGFQDICEFKGKARFAEYTFKEITIRKEVQVGGDSCLGACGKDCFGTNRPYTQECLNHDLCHRDTKNLIECHDELKKAFRGFIFAPDC